jgi:hypothetical protein
MKTLLLVFSVLQVQAQIAPSLSKLENGRTLVRLKNTATAPLVAFAVRVTSIDAESGKRSPQELFIDSAVETVPVAEHGGPKQVTLPLPPGEEYSFLPSHFIPAPLNRSRAPAVLPSFEPDVLTAGIFADGTTTGDGALLTRLMFRRCQLLEAVETSLEMLMEAGQQNVPRKQMIAQFERMATSTRRSYLPAEQQVGLTIYQPLIGKLLNLPPGELGTPFPPTDFVKQETAALNRLRVTLMAVPMTISDARTASPAARP